MRSTCQHTAEASSRLSWYCCVAFGELDAHLDLEGPDIKVRQSLAGQRYHGVRELLLLVCEVDPAVAVRYKVMHKLH